MRIHYEFDQLRKKLNDSPTERLVSLGSLGEKVRLRDDFSVELAALYNFTGQYEKALTWLGEKTFHPWEGGEGQVLRQYSYACLQLGQQALQNGKPHEALRYFEQSLNTPHNLGEKYHPLQAVAHINYWKGRACKALQRYEEANHYFAQSAREEGDFVDMAVSAYSELSYYKALSLMELQQPDQALELLQNIARYGEAKLRQKARIDYFATSLPLLLVFEDDLQKKQTIEATYLMGLAALGAANRAKAAALFEEVLRNDAMHMGAHHHLLAMHEPLEPTLYDLESE